MLIFYFRMLLRRQALLCRAPAFFAYVPSSLRRYCMNIVSSPCRTPSKICCIALGTVRLLTSHWQRGILETPLDDHIALRPAACALSPVDVAGAVTLVASTQLQNTLPASLRPASQLADVDRRSTASARGANRTATLPRSVVITTTRLGRLTARIASRMGRGRSVTGINRGCIRDSQACGPCLLAFSLRKVPYFWGEASPTGAKSAAGPNPHSKFPDPQ